MKVGFEVIEKKLLFLNKIASTPAKKIRPNIAVMLQRLEFYLSPKGLDQDTMRFLLWQMEHKQVVSHPFFGLFLKFLAVVIFVIFVFGVKVFEFFGC